MMESAKHKRENDLYTVVIVSSVWNNEFFGHERNKKQKVKPKDGARATVLLFGMTKCQNNIQRN